MNRTKTKAIPIIWAFIAIIGCALAIKLIFAPLEKYVHENTQPKTNEKTSDVIGEEESIAIIDTTWL